MSLEITRGEHSIEELRRAACRCGDSKQARRLLGLAMALEGNTREMAATAAGMTRQTLRDWVIRYNENGVDGLKDKPRPGRRPGRRQGRFCFVWGRLMVPGVHRLDQREGDAMAALPRTQFSDV